MAHRPSVIAFDVLETLFSLEPLGDRLRAAGLPPHSLELWFAQTLRSGFALAASDTYRPFREVATGTLRVLLANHDRPDSEEVVETILQGFSELPPHADVAPTFRFLRQRGLRVLALSNGAAAVTRELFRKAGLEEEVEQVLSIDDVKQWKPRREVYLHAARAAGVEPARVALVAAHAWDVHGARKAGLVGGWVRRGDRLFLPAMGQPDVSGDTLPEVCAALADLPE